MVASCAAFKCTTRYKKGENVKFHRFPKDICVRKKWLEALRRANYKPSDRAVICSNHFLEEDYEINVHGNKVLKKGVTPSRFDYSLHLGIKTHRPRRKAAQSDDEPLLGQNNGIDEACIEESCLLAETTSDTTVLSSTTRDTTVLISTTSDTTVLPSIASDTTALISTRSDTTVLPSTTSDKTTMLSIASDVIVLPSTTSDTTVLISTTNDTTVLPSITSDTTVEVSTTSDTTVLPSTTGDKTITSDILVLPSTTSDTMVPSSITSDAMALASTTSDVAVLASTISDGTVPPSASNVNIYESTCTSKGVNCPESNRWRRRRRNPVYVGEYTLEDLEDPRKRQRYFELSTSTIDEYRKCNKRLRAQIQRRTKQIADLDKRIDDLKKNSKLSSKACNFVKKNAKKQNLSGQLKASTRIHSPKLRNFALYPIFS